MTRLTTPSEKNPARRRCLREGASGRGKRFEPTRNQLAAASSRVSEEVGVSSNLRSLSMIRSIVRTQPPQLRPARQAMPTSLREQAPSRTALRMVRSETPWQWQTIMGVLAFGGDSRETENEVQYRFQFEPLICLMEKMLSFQLVMTCFAVFPGRKHTPYSGYARSSNLMSGSASSAGFSRPGGVRDRECHAIAQACLHTTRLGRDRGRLARVIGWPPIHLRASGCWATGPRPDAGHRAPGTEREEERVTA